MAKEKTTIEDLRKLRAQYEIGDRVAAQPKGYFNILKQGFSIKSLKNRFKDKFFPDKTVLVNMELTNGMHRTFLVVEKNRSFKYKNGIYLLDDDSKYFNIDAKLWQYDFHENYCLPIKRAIPVTDIKKVLESAEISEVEYASNPMTLERFIIARVAEGIMKGQQLDEFMRQLRLMVIIIMATALIHLLLFAWKSGMLQQVKIPGIIG